MSQSSSKKGFCKPIIARRVRSIGKDGFSYIPNQFFHGGFWEYLTHDELLLYFLLVIVSNRLGISFYHYDSLCQMLKMNLDRYIKARNSLIDKDMIAFDGTSFQVLALPEKQERKEQTPLKNQKQFEQEDGATIRQILIQSLGIDKG